jgi:hypothetical protein
MRKIEQQMNRAINQQKSWCSGNTSVTVWDDRTEVHLHGHHIATVQSDGEVDVNLRTLAKWPTVTTKSRLRALGVNIYQKNWDVYVDGVVVA